MPHVACQIHLCGPRTFQKLKILNFDQVQWFWKFFLQIVAQKSFFSNKLRLTENFSLECGHSINLSLKPLWRRLWEGVKICVTSFVYCPVPSFPQEYQTKKLFQAVISVCTLPDKLFCWFVVWGHPHCFFLYWTRLAEQKWY